MSERPLGEDADGGTLGPDERRAQESLRALPPVAPDRAYRERMKAAFASGALEEPARAAAAVEDHPARPVRGPIPFPWGGGARGWRVAVAIAATIVVVVGAGLLNQGPPWQIAAVRGEGTITLDGVPLATADAVAGRRLEPGVSVEVPDGVELELRAGRLLVMQCTPGTRLVLPPTPPRWFARRSALYARAGEIRVMTGPEFQGARLLINTPEAALAVTGTTFAVIMEPTGTCVCVYEGAVMVGAHDAPMARVPSGMRRYVFRDGRPPEDAGMRDMERVKLGEFQKAMMPAMGAR